MAVRTRPRSDVQINLLPAQIQAQKKLQRAYRIAVSGAIVVGVILLAVTVLQRLQIADEQGTLREEQARAAAVNAKVAQLRQFDVLNSSAAEARTYLASAMTNDISWSRFLDDLDTVVPGDSWLGTLTMAAKPGMTELGETSYGTISFAGFVTQMPGLANWLDTMEKLDGLRFVYLSNGNKQRAGEGAPEIVSFTANAHVTESLLSGRCQKEGTPCP